MSARLHRLLGKGRDLVFVSLHEALGITRYMVHHSDAPCAIDQMLRVLVKQVAASAPPLVSVYIVQCKHLASRLLLFPGLFRRSGRRVIFIRNEGRGPRLGDKHGLGLLILIRSELFEPASWCIVE